MADLQQQLATSQAGNAQLQLHQTELQKRLSSREAELAATATRLEEEEQSTCAAQTQLQTVRPV